MELVKPLIFSLIMVAIHFNRISEKGNAHRRVKYIEKNFEYNWRNDYYSGKENLDSLSNVYKK